LTATLTLLDPAAHIRVFLASGRRHCYLARAAAAFTLKSYFFKVFLDYDPSLLARDAFVRTNRRAIAMMLVRLSFCAGRAL